MRADINRHLGLSNKLRILFGGPLVQFAWFFLSFGMIFVWVFVFKIDFSFIHFQGEIVKTKGVVTRIAETSMEINDNRVFEYYYEFKDKEGRVFDSYSYSSTSYAEENSKVNVEYPASRIDLSRIKGMRREPFPLVALLVLIFPAIGLYLIYYGYKEAIQAIRLLQHGLMSRGKLVSKKPTNTRINDRQVYKLKFTFEDQYGKEHFVETKTHITELLEDEEYERLLYLPQNPQDAVMVDSVPSNPIIDERGNISPVSVNGWLTWMILPIVSIIGHGGYALSLLVG